MAGFVVLDISQEDYDKAIKAKAIEEFAEAVNKKITEFVLAHKDNLDFASGISIAWNIIDEIAEELKQEGGENGRA
ncbi:MAG: hypothetical protein ABS949_14880 [Solibacillus sp.]